MPKYCKSVRDFINHACEVAINLLGVAKFKLHFHILTVNEQYSAVLISYNTGKYGVTVCNERSQY